MKLDRWAALLVAVGVLDVILTVRLAFDEVAGFPPVGWLNEPVLTGLAGATTGVILIVGVSIGGRRIRRSESELHRRAAELEATARTTQDWLWECDTAGMLTYSSPAVETLLGYSPEELVGRHCLDLMADDDGRALLASSLVLDSPASHLDDDKDSQITTRPEQPGSPRSSGFRSSGWDRIEGRWRHRSGHTVWLTDTGTPIRDQHGHIFGYRGTRRLLDGPETSRGARDAARDRVQHLLTHGGVRTALQPIVDLQTGRLVGAEALARFNDGRGPRQWFEDAANAGLTRQLDELTFFTALATLRALPNLGYLSVNASPSLLLDPTFRNRLLRTRTDLSRLVIELTEHERVADYRELNTALAHLRGRGIRFAIDDTGAGYSSLNHVLQLRPDIIKLDRELIVDLETDRARRALVTALVLLALETGSTVLGEGVENHRQIDILTTLGVDQAQGYALAHPSISPGDWHTWHTHQWLPHTRTRQPID